MVSDHAPEREDRQFIAIILLAATHHAGKQVSSRRYYIPQFCLVKRDLRIASMSNLFGRWIVQIEVST